MAYIVIHVRANNVGVGLTNGIFLNYTYRDGKPLICYECEGPLRGGFCWFCDSRAETSFANDPNLNSFDDSQNLSDYSPQPQYETYLCELCGNDSHYGYDCPPRTYTPEPSRCFNPICYDNDEDYDYKESTIPLNEINSQIPPSNAITTSPPVLPIKDPEVSLIMRNEDLNTIPKKESDEFIKSSVEDLIPILNKSKDTSRSENDIIFGSTNKELCKSFEKLMKDKFQMSLMGELTFFFGLQVKQKDNGIFINQDKYVAEILRKFGLTDGKSASTPIETKKPLLKDPNGEDVDVHIYWSMIGSLMYLTSSRPDIIFAVCACLWYPKDSPFNLMEYSNSDYAGASLDRKSTTGGCQFLGCRLISWQCKKQTVVATSSTEAEYRILRQNLRLDDADVIDCLPNEEIFAELARIGYEKPNKFSSFMASGVICLATVMINAQVDDLSSHNTKYTSPALTHKVFANIRRIGKGFSRVETPLFDAMLVQQQVHDDVAAVEEDEDNEALEIVKLKQRVRKLEQKRRTKHSGLKRLRKDTDEAEPAEVEEVLEVVIAAKLMTKVVTTVVPIITIAQVPKVSAPRRRRGVVIQDFEETTEASVIVHSELEAELNANINWNDVIEQVKRSEKQDNTVMRYQALKRKTMTEAQERKNMMIYLKNMTGFKMDFFKGMTYSKIRPIFEKHYNSIQAFLEKEEEEVIVQEKRQEQMLNNVRLEVKEESEMLLELLRLVKRQLHEGYVSESRVWIHPPTDQAG
uniref:Uncharacterized mitochondrial protein AtMg00810-like n=1 Tax=Tanacetum cinerariifolium TaxID=118510 RepID=A0A6L2JEU1_TANCI|nr:uncharacterized mitochondrial protein AtMg00810-like [Tanacetum cinerariifolium]